MKLKLTEANFHYYLVMIEKYKKIQHIKLKQKQRINTQYTFFQMIETKYFTSFIVNLNRPRYLGIINNFDFR